MMNISLLRTHKVKARRLLLISWAVLACIALLPGRALACACCTNAGDYFIGFDKPSEYELGLMGGMRFGGAAHLYSTEAGPEESARGLDGAAETYAVSGSLVGRAWRLTFRDGNKTGTLSLPLPAKMLSYKADIRDGQTSPGGGPLLYKEWRFEGPVSGTGIFRAGIEGPTKYFLVLQGRGNACDDAENFKHWRLKVTGRKAEYAFYGELAGPSPR
jgi:hypothetical protein